MIKVLIVDDQDIFRQGLKMLLSANEELHICGEASNGREAIVMCNAYTPDIVLMDMKMPEMDGAIATKEIMSKHPNMKIIILTTFNDDDYIFKSLKYGAAGYLLKESSPHDIMVAIKKAYSGGVVIQPEIASILVKQFSGLSSINVLQDDGIKILTERELSILSEIGKGKNNKEISKELFISEGTVKNHITAVLGKLELRDRTQLAIYAVKNNV